MTHGSLFSGIGGFDLAAQWMGWENVFQVEIDPFCQKVLEKNFPTVKRYGDIKQFDGTKYRGAVDILTGGFPCQPYSTAGKRKGKEDDRHLWPEMLRAIREIQPSWVVGENVRGLTNWNGGMVFDEVQADLEAEGYEVTPFLLPACAVNAPHRRDRIWFVTYAEGKRRRKEGNDFIRSEERTSGNGREWIAPDTDSSTGTQREYRKTGCAASEDKSEGNQWERVRGFAERTSKEGIVTNSATGGLQGEQSETYRQFTINRNTWNQFPTQSPLCGGDDGLPRELDGITFSKWRNESLKGYGNAIVPQIAFEIFKAIQSVNDQYEKL